MLGFWNNYNSFNGMGVKTSSLKYSFIQLSKNCARLSSEN